MRARRFDPRGLDIGAYDAHWLGALVREMESKHGLSSETFMEALEADHPAISYVPEWDRQAWACAWAELQDRT